jgi:type I site-specific restriction endonuclease
VVNNGICFNSSKLLTDFSSAITKSQKAVMSDSLTSAVDSEMVRRNANLVAQINEMKEERKRVEEQYKKELAERDSQFSEFQKQLDAFKAENSELTEKNKQLIPVQEAMLKKSKDMYHSKIEPWMKKCNEDEECENKFSENEMALAQQAYYSTDPAVVPLQEVLATAHANDMSSRSKLEAERKRRIELEASNAESKELLNIQASGNPRKRSLTEAMKSAPTEAAAGSAVPAVGAPGGGNDASHRLSTMLRSMNNFTRKQIEEVAPKVEPDTEYGSNPTLDAVAALHAARRGL